MSFQFVKWFGAVVEPINTRLDCHGDGRIFLFCFVFKYLKEWGQHHSHS